MTARDFAQSTPRRARHVDVMFNPNTTTMIDTALNSYKTFFDSVTTFKEKQNKQKQRGFNNYNILTSVLKSTDEVRLHSGMIYSFLNPDGDHYQGTLFLDLFLESLSIDTFKININSCTVHKEYNNIDIYITDGHKHIIIENKINAGDQKEQIKRYIKTITNEYQNISYDDVLVIYLSIDKRNPSQYSLANLSIVNNHIQTNNKKVALYKAISYKKEIIEWLRLCQFEVQNIINLNEAIRQYIDVVKMINNEYKERMMSLSSYLKKDKETYKMALDVHNTFPETRKDLIESFLADISKTLRENLGGDWVIKIDNGALPKKYSQAVKIHKKAWLDNCLLFCFEFSKNDYYDGYFGIVKSNKKIDLDSDICVHFKTELEQLHIELETTEGWLHWEWLPNIPDTPGLPEYIMFDDNPKEKFINGILSMINTFEIKSGLLTKINSYLQNRDN